MTGSGKILEWYNDYCKINKIVPTAREIKERIEMAINEEKPNGSTLSPTVYSEHCPHCDSENITMVGNPEYNDEWECEDCKEIFSSFKTKIVNAG